MAPSVAPGLLESFLPRDRCIALASGRAIPDVVTGTAVFADISGFTPLTEEIVRTHGAHRGAEELTRTLNGVYEQIIGDVTAHGGVVMYLSGDAITCWFDGDDGAAAVQSGLDMQRSMTALGDERLALKVAVAAGSARRLVVGDPEQQLLDVLAGPLVDVLAATEGITERGEVVVDESVIAALGGRLAVSTERVLPALGRRVGVVAALSPPVPRQPVTPAPPLPVDVVGDWLLPDVYDRLSAGSDLFLAELRTAYPIFVRFGGFDFDDDGVVELLDDFVRAAQRTLAAYGGTLLGLTVGDKGAYLNAVMGAPRSHEDDARRAVAAALAIRKLEGRAGVNGIQVGVSVGRIYSGTYGATVRRTLSVIGDPTNLAARLMTAAPAGEAYVFEPVAAAVDDHFEWSDVEPLTLKGKREPVRARSLQGERRRRTQRVRRYPLPMIGRDGELATVRALLDDARAGNRRVVSIDASAGVGKSRFVAELLRLFDAEGVPVAFGQGDSMSRATSYHPWREATRQLVGLDEERPDAEQIDRLDHVVRSVDPGLAARLPLLGDVVGLDIAPTPLVATFDAKLRKSSLEHLVADIVVHLLATGPRAIVLDDLHWADPLSVDLLRTVVRRTAGRSALFVLAHRTEDGREIAEALADLPDRTDITLGELEPDGLRTVVGAVAGQVFGPTVVPAGAIVDLVLERSQGNPLYAEELLRYMERAGVDPTDPAAARTLELPESLQAIVLSRVDGLPELPRQAVKVASVVGREFPASLLADVHDALGDEELVLGHLAPARAVDLVVPERESLVDWLFRHPITRDVAYESLPYGVRAPLHERVGDAIARRDGVAPRIFEIADHYWHSENVDKQRHFLRLAADAARDRYANDAAIRFYERLVSVLDGGERVRAMLDLAGVLELVGDWALAETSAAEARAIAEAGGDAAAVGWCDVSLAEIARKRGQYVDAERLLRQAHAVFVSGGDDAGAARALHLLGTVAAQQGDLDAAVTRYEESRTIRERTGDRAGLAAILSNLGVVKNYQADYDAAIDHHQQSLELRSELGDLGAISVSHTNIGIIAVARGRYDEALAMFEEALRLSRAVGDVWMVAISQNNIGNALRGLARFDEACGYYAAAMAAYRDYEDRWALAFLIEDVAVLAALAGDPLTALEVLGAADAMRDATEARRPDSQTDELDRWIAPTLVGLADDAVASARARGRALDEHDALDQVSAYCNRERSAR